MDQPTCFIIGSQVNLTDMADIFSLEGIDQALLAAHVENDHKKLVFLYSQAGAELIEADIDGACFYYTQALVFALESGDKRADEIREILIANGREEQT